MKKLWMIAAVTSVLLSACKKEEPVVVPAPTNAELLQRSSWQLTDHLQIIGTSNFSIYNQEYDACEQDNIYTFAANNLFIQDEGATKCFTTNPQRDTTYWNLESDVNITMVRIIDTDTLRGTIGSVDSAQLTVNFRVNNINNRLVYSAR